ncbi:hypothetical protein B0H67DRAFT_578192 [Lasiosphaeris hirsuta]|uniref:Uncharacterized protein n=1 Tax=Lasiosphaeris hirsuta TaxID=260670 RepID=A0AA40ASF3_9PEZI|nr:hypothetical protein B0H67DRAFT_578192 [Lasiosphaeris hirsuta]
MATPFPSSSLTPSCLFGTSFVSAIVAKCKEVMPLWSRNPVFESVQRRVTTATCPLYTAQSSGVFPEPSTMSIFAPALISDCVAGS